MKRSLFAALCAGFSVACVGAAQADPHQPYGMDRSSGHQTAPNDLPHCDRPLGTAAVKEPPKEWWVEYNLPEPDAVIKMFALRSGCFRMVDRNQGLAMHGQEEALGEAGELQRRSNVGRGQVLAADYFLIPDITHQNGNSGGGNIGAAFGHFLPGAIGGVVGSIDVRSKQASTLITLVDARTTEQLYVAEGAAQKTDIGFGGGGGWGGWSGWGAVAGSAYQNTDIGQVIMAAYYKAFTDLVHYAQQQQPGSAQENAPLAAETMTRDAALRRASNPGAPVVLTLHAGALVYPTGKRDGVWMEVDDENGNRGWISSAFASPR
jgi:curli biogenesis system outer membrane secretion channel CsgG